MLHPCPSPDDRRYTAHRFYSVRLGARGSSTVGKKAKARREAARQADSLRAISAAPTPQGASPAGAPARASKVRMAVNVREHGLLVAGDKASTVCVADVKVALPGKV